MRHNALTVLLGATLLSAAPIAEAQELPGHVTGLIGMRCSTVRRAIEREGHELLVSRGPVIYESGAGRMRTTSMTISRTGVVLYCEQGRIVGFAAGRLWGRGLFEGVHPGLNPFDAVATVRRSLGEPADDRFARRGGDGGGTWVSGRLLLHYSVCLRC